MLVKLLGAFDIFVAIVLFIIATKIVSVSTALLVVLIIVLAIKSIPGLTSFCLGSIIDIIIAIMLIICIITTPYALVLLIAAFAIAQKGVMSFL